MRFRRQVAQNIRRPPSARALGLTIVLFLLGLVASAPSAFAHAAFLESTPEPGGSVSTPPREVSLEFTEPLNEGLTEATLVEAASGERVGAAARFGAERRLALRPERRLEQGAYRLDWHTVSTIDGHVREGSISFGVGVGPTGNAAAEVERSPLARDGWLRVGGRAVLYVALFAFAGGALAGALIDRRGRPGAWLFPSAVRTALARAGGDPERSVERATRRTVAAGRVAVVAAAAVALVEAIDAAGGLSASGAADFLLTNGAGLARVATVGALVLSVLAVRRFPGPGAAFAAVALAAIALSGHANSAEPRLAAVANDSVHLAAGAVWTGGIAQIVWNWAPLVRGGGRGLRLAVAREVLPRFGRVALPAFLVVAATGTTNALLQLGHPEALWSTAYGRVLALKVGLVALIAAASYLHAFRLRPRLLAANPHPSAAIERRHWRLIRSEPLIAGAVLAAAALLVAFPVPPRELGESGEALAAAPACDPYCPFAQPAPDELAVGAPAGPYTAGAWISRDGGRASGTLRVVTGDRQPAPVTAAIAGARREEPCGEACWRFELRPGTEALRVLIRGEGGRYRLVLPAAWRSGSNARARELLRSTQSEMRALESMRQREVVESAAAGSGPRPRGTSVFRFEPPKRIAFRTASSEVIRIGDREWFRASGVPWEVRRATTPNQALPSNRFRWTTFEESARLLEMRHERARRIAELAFLDYGYPVWYRVTVDLASRRALSASLVTPDNRIEDHYFAFDEPVRIEPPLAAGSIDP